MSTNPESMGGSRLTSALAWAPSAGPAYSDDDGSPAESMTGESPDRALVDAVLSGDDEAFRVLVALGAWALMLLVLLATRSTAAPSISSLA